MTLEHTFYIFGVIYFTAATIEIVAKFYQAKEVKGRPNAAFYTSLSDTDSDEFYEESSGS